MSELSHEQLTFVLKFFHPEKDYPTLSDQAIAMHFEIPVETYCQIKSECAAATKQAAQELLAEPGFAARVDNLPFASGSTVLGLGDSITDDWQSWIEILRALLSIRRPNDQIRVVNAGFSGETTTDLLYRALP